MKRALSILLLAVPLLLAAQPEDPCLPKKPDGEEHLVHQFTDFLSEHELQRLDEKLTRFAGETSNRILVLIVDDLCGYEASDYAVEIGQTWGIGGKKLDNGLVVLVKPTGTPSQRKVYIATGYGLEGAVPDLLCKRIVEEEIIPYFKKHEFFEGLDRGTDVLMSAAKGEINEQSYGEGGMKGETITALLVVAGIFLLVLIITIAQRKRVRRYATTNGIDFWTAWWLLNQAGRSHRGSWGGFTGGGGGWSGGGGGGFGGFGGGSFGGGGAGGSW